MDTQFFGSNLAAIDQVQADRRRSSGETTEDAYYKLHTPADRRFPSVASAVAVIAFGVVTFGLWLQ